MHFIALALREATRTPHEHRRLSQLRDLPDPAQAPTHPFDVVSRPAKDDHVGVDATEPIGLSGDHEPALQVRHGDDLRERLDSRLLQQRNFAVGQGPHVEAIIHVSFEQCRDRDDAPVLSEV